MGNPRPYGIGTLTFLVIANMVGAGVFTTSGYALQALGSPGRVLAAWAVAGLIAICGAVSYGRLVRVMPESGGEYLYLARAVHPFAGFLAGWVSLIAGFTGAIAFAATALEGYVFTSASRPGWLAEDAVAVGVVILGAVAHGVRVRSGAWLQNTAVVCKLVFLAVFLGLAASWLGRAGWAGAPLADADARRFGLVPVFATALVWISLSYSGFNAAVYVTEEARDARQAVPRALLLGTLTVTALYLLLNAVFVYGPPAGEVAGQHDIAAIAALWLGGPRFALLIRAVIALALFTSVLSMMMAAPRVYAKMAEDGLLPDALRFGRDAPRVAIGLQAVLAILVILVSTLRGLLDYLGLTLSLCAAAAVASLFSPTVRASAARQGWAVPVWIYLVATVAAAGIMAVADPRRLLATVITLAVGSVAYWFMRRRFADRA